MKINHLGKIKEIIMLPLQNIFCQLGICLYDEYGKYKSFVDIINDLSKVWNTLTEKQKELFANIFKENENEK